MTHLVSPGPSPETCLEVSNSFPIVLNCVRLILVNLIGIVCRDIEFGFVRGEQQVVPRHDGIMAQALCDA